MSYATAMSELMDDVAKAMKKFNDNSDMMVVGIKVGTDGYISYDLKSKEVFKKSVERAAKRKAKKTT